MAIVDLSIYNQYLAIGITEQGASALDLFSGGTLPEPIRAQILDIISESLGNSVPGNVPNELYSIIASIMLPYTPGMTLNSLTNALRVNNIFGNVDSLENIDGIIDNAISAALAEYNVKLLSIAGKIDAQLGVFGLGGTLTNLVGDVLGTARNLINDSIEGIVGSKLSVKESNIVSSVLTGTGTPEDLGLTPDDFGGVQDLSDLSEHQRASLAASIIADRKEVPVEQIPPLVNALKGIQRTVAGLFYLELPSEDSYVIDGNNLSAGGNNISSVEELEAEMSNIYRPISEIIVHWSETFTNANLTADDLELLTGAGTNAYHLIIKRDGSIERGVPLNEKGNHCQTLGHNEYSIGVCLVGGLNVASGSKDIFESPSSRSITRSQYNTLYEIFRVFFMRFPGGQALGHMEIDPTQSDPGFEVRDYVYNNFNKQSLYTDPTTQNALSPEDILEVIEGEEKLQFLEKDPDVMDRKF
jgi:N-acetyl-anhydromuramyl-L-alanine amidase AmpD